MKKRYYCSVQHPILVPSVGNPLGLAGGSQILATTETTPPSCPEETEDKKRKSHQLPFLNLRNESLTPTSNLDRGRGRSRGRSRGHGRGRGRLSTFSVAY